jgi:hypothetical protein
MKIGDVIKATWTDGLVLVGKFSRNERGYIILLDNNGKTIVCNPRSVEFEVVNESR